GTTAGASHSPANNECLASRALYRIPRLRRVQRTNLHVALRLHGIGALPHPLDRFLDRFDVPQCETGDHFLRLREWPVYDRALLAREAHALRKAGRHEPAEDLILQNTRGDEGLDVLVHDLQRLGGWLHGVLGVFGRFHENHDYHRHLLSWYGRSNPRTFQTFPWRRFATEIFPLRKPRDSCDSSARHADRNPPPGYRTTVRGKTAGTTIGAK